jgi:hypothetical protein
MVFHGYASAADFEMKLIFLFRKFASPNANARLPAQPAKGVDPTVRGWLLLILFHCLTTSQRPYSRSADPNATPAII